jgi:uncharacterized membrane protein
MPLFASLASLFLILYTYRMKTIILKDAWNSAWSDFKNNGWFLVGVVAVFFLVSFVANTVSNRLEINGSYFFFVLINLVSYVINALLTLGLIAISLKIIRKQEATWKDLIGYSNILAAYIGASILFGIGVFFGMLLLIVPGCIFLTVYSFYVYGLVDKKLKIMESFKHSARITKGVRWKLFGLCILLGLFNVVGFLFFFVGILFTYPITLLVVAHVYQKLSLESTVIPETEVVVQPQELPAQ